MRMAGVLAFARGIFLNRKRERLYVRHPLFFGATAKGAIPNAFFGEPLTYCFGGSINGHQAIASRITHLLNSRRPPNVAGSIWSVVIWIAIYFMILGWPWSYRSKECCEVFSPFITHHYPTITVMLVVIGLWMMAAINHQSPNIILRGLAHTVCHAGRMATLHPQAPTGLGQSPAEIRHPDFFYFSAITLTFSDGASRYAY